MNLRKVIVLFAVFSSLGAFSGGCQSGGVGDPCTPEDEYQQRFSGFSPAEVNIESRSFQCETRVCLVNHFRGRVTCPLGQDEELAAKAKAYMDAKRAGTTPPADFKPTDPKACRLPGSSGANAEVVETSVLPQCTTRQAKDTVYCSCRCDGPDKNAKYCECPSGFSCKKFDEFDLGAAVAKGSANLRGSYCVKDDPKTINYNPTVCTQTATYNSADDSCADGANAKACGAQNGNP